MEVRLASWVSTSARWHRSAPRGDPRSSVADALSTMVVDGTHVKLPAWYDNEWGYANRMVEIAQMIASGFQAA